MCAVHSMLTTRGKGCRIVIKSSSQCMDERKCNYSCEISGSNYFIRRVTLLLAFVVLKSERNTKNTEDGLKSHQSLTRRFNQL